MPDHPQPPPEGLTNLGRFIRRRRLHTDAEPHQTESAIARDTDDALARARTGPLSLRTVTEAQRRDERSVSRAVGVGGSGSTTNLAVNAATYNTLHNQTTNVNNYYNPVERIAPEQSGQQPERRNSIRRAVGFVTWLVWACLASCLRPLGLTIIACILGFWIISRSLHSLSTQISDLFNQTSMARWTGSLWSWMSPRSSPALPLFPEEPPSGSAAPGAGSVQNVRPIFYGAAALYNAAGVILDDLTDLPLLSGIPLATGFAVAVSREIGKAAKADGRAEDRESGVVGPALVRNTVSAAESFMRRDHDWKRDMKRQLEWEKRAGELLADREALEAAQAPGKSNDKNNDFWEWIVSFWRQSLPGPLAASSRRLRAYGELLAVAAEHRGGVTGRMASWDDETELHAAHGHMCGLATVATTHLRELRDDGPSSFSSSSGATFESGTEAEADTETGIRSEVLAEQYRATDRLFSSTASNGKVLCQLIITTRERARALKASVAEEHTWVGNELVSVSKLQDKIRVQQVGSSLVDDFVDKGLQYWGEYKMKRYMIDE